MYMGVNVMVVDGVRQWMWAVGEIGTGLGNVLGNRVICLFSGILLATHPLGLCLGILLRTLCPLRRHIGILLGTLCPLRLRGRYPLL